MKRDHLKLDQYRFTIRPLTAEDGTGYLIESPMFLCVCRTAQPWKRLSPAAGMR
jgi:hypothetical protein